MPDSQLFKSLCDILKISVNDLISGEEVAFDDYIEKCDENIISIMDYTNRKISEENNMIVETFLIIGLLVVILYCLLACYFYQIMLVMYQNI